MNEIEGYIEETVIFRTCAFCRWHYPELPDDETIGGNVYYCSHETFDCEVNGVRFIGINLATPSWCPVGKAVLPSDDKDC